MRRLSLSAKLFVAALPLLLAIVALLGLSIRDNLEEVDRAERAAQLAGAWQPLITLINAVEDEQAVSATGDTDALTTARSATNARMVEMNTAIEAIPDSQPLTLQLGESLAALGLAREAVDSPDIAAARGTTAAQSYDAAENELVNLGSFLPAEAGDARLGRELAAVTALARIEQTGDQLVDELYAVRSQALSERNVNRAEVLAGSLDDAIGEFQSIAPTDWQEAFREAGYTRALNNGLRAVERLVANPTGLIDPELVATPVVEVGEFRDTLADEIVDRADATVTELTTRTRVEAAVTIGAIVLASLLAWFVTRSITRRVRAVKAKAAEVSEEQLPTLVNALRDPRAHDQLPDVTPLDERGSDELADLARSFNAMESTLVHVAQEQVEVLRRGVSEIFVTMARRNRSLVDRQLALLDELEADVDDPEVLGNYYRLDHLATRMRRNSESLLVLANAEPKRRRTKATEIDDVVRAAIGEVEDYQRVQVEHLDQLQVKGAVVADVAHLLAELLDNATSFSPPESHVTVSGRFVGETYLLRITDEGVGITPERLAELNHLLANPPVVGLSVEPTLGMSVVSLLAHRHDIRVELAAGSPGTTAEVMIPAALFGPIDAVTSDPFAAAFTERMPSDATGVVPGATATTPAVAPAPLVLEVREPAVVEPTPEPEPEPAIDEPMPVLSLDALPALEELTFASDQATVVDRLAEVTGEPTPSLPQRGAVTLPPPPPAQPAVVGEFDRPPAHPSFVPSAPRPVVDPNAVPVPTMRPEPAPTSGATPGLPTRAGAASSALDGPDRLADQPVGVTAPTALAAALAAFDQGRNGALPRADQTPPEGTAIVERSTAEPVGVGALPTRQRLDLTADDPSDAPLSTAVSRLDPEAIRERLRAFQTERTTGTDRPQGDPS
ncbi:MAG: HAMP domain-containing protein [Ilumatobacteraceae bacterium]|nr:HAMP domain-containing protein [Ilumatobacteraceae bacterium]